MGSMRTKETTSMPEAFVDILSCKQGEHSFQQLYDAAYTITMKNEFEQFSQEAYGAISKFMRDKALPALESAEDGAPVMQPALKRYNLASAAFKDMASVFLYGQKDQEVHALSISAFRDSCFLLHNNNIGMRLQAAMLEAVKRFRMNEAVEAALCKAVAELLMALSTSQNTNAARSHSNNRANSARCYYEMFFETNFLRDSREFYKDEVRKLLSTKSLTEYISGVEALMQKESQLLRLVHESSKEPLFKAQTECLIADCLHQVLECNDTDDENANTVGTAVNSKNFEILGRLQDLLRSSYPDGLAHLQNSVLTAFVVQSTLIVREQNGPELAEQLLRLYHTFGVEKDSFSHKLFARDAVFENSLRTHCINVLETEKSKCSESMASYADKLLQKSNKELVYDDVKKQLVRIVDFSRLLPEKDLFESFYKMKLAKRLLHKTSSSDDMEKDALSLLKPVCSIEFMRAVECMFSDLRRSSEISQAYKARLKDVARVKDIDLHVDILQDGKWPLTKLPSVQLTGNVQAAFASYKSYYDEIHSNRKLELNSTLGFAEITATFYGKLSAADDAAAAPRVYTLCVNTPQMLILSLFNDKTTWTFQEILTTTALDPKMCSENLNALSRFAKQQILNKRPAKAGEIVAADVFSINEQFSSPTRRVKVARIVVTKAARVADDAKARDETFAERKYRLEAALVRTMKSHQTLSMQNLISNCVELVKSTFKPDVLAIKQRIEDLIGREYIRRDDADKTKLHYIA